MTIFLYTQYRNTVNNNINRHLVARPVKTSNNTSTVIDNTGFLMNSPDNNKTAAEA